jgi:hypothetical protein
MVDPKTLDTYLAALAADSAYHDALVAAYGKNAGDARYDRKLNAATPELARLRAEKIAADDAHLSDMRR